MTPPDLALVMTKHHGSRLGFAVLLAFFRDRGRFPRTAGEIDPSVVEELARQLAVAAPPGFAPILAGRTAERHRAEIRALAGFREASVADAALLEGWLRGQDPSLPHGSRYAALSITGRIAPNASSATSPNCSGDRPRCAVPRPRRRRSFRPLPHPPAQPAARRSDDGLRCRVQAPVSDIQPMPQIGNDAVFVDNPFAKTGDIHGQLAPLSVTGESTVGRPTVKTWSTAVIPVDSPGRNRRSTPGGNSTRAAPPISFGERRDHPRRRASALIASAEMPIRSAACL